MTTVKTSRSSRIGKTKLNIPTPEIEYRRLDEDDEAAAHALADSGHFRQAVYLFVQAMEKHIRAAIFMRVNPNTTYFRENTRTHNVDELLDFLVEIVGGNDIVRQQASRTA